jgi:hypothetical protein
MGLYNLFHGIGMDDASSFHMTIILLQIMVVAFQFIVLVLALRTYHRITQQYPSRPRGARVERPQPTN